MIHVSGLCKASYIVNVNDLLHWTLHWQGRSWVKMTCPNNFQIFPRVMEILPYGRHQHVCPTFQRLSLRGICRHCINDFPECSNLNNRWIDLQFYRVFFPVPMRGQLFGVFIVVLMFGVLLSFLFCFGFLVLSVFTIVLQRHHYNINVKFTIATCVISVRTAENFTNQVISEWSDPAKRSCSSRQIFLVVVGEGCQLWFTDIGGNHITFWSQSRCIYMSIVCHFHEVQNLNWWPSFFKQQIDYGDILEIDLVPYKKWCTIPMKLCLFVITTCTLLLRTTSKFSVEWLPYLALSFVFHFPSYWFQINNMLKAAAERFMLVKSKHSIYCLVRIICQCFVITITVSGIITGTFPSVILQYDEFNSFINSYASISLNITMTS